MDNVRRVDGCGVIFDVTENNDIVTLQLIRQNGARYINFEKLHGVKVTPDNMRGKVITTTKNSMKVGSIEVEVETCLLELKSDECGMVAVDVEVTDSPDDVRETRWFKVEGDKLEDI